MIGWLAVFFGGGMGSLARYGVARWVSAMGWSGYPYATFIANMASCLVLGVMVKFFSARPELDTAWKLLVLVGFCGGFSTFSTFSHETVLLMREGQLGWAVMNVLLSVSACVGLLYILSRNPVS
ncbi:MAG: fluoride efflux transporter CrcB [Flavobacteriales bacterium]|nr:fluoride efflux transporter CrcB [Flavobacteriales bacterium]